MKNAKKKFYSILRKYITRVHPDDPPAEIEMANSYRQRNRSSKIGKFKYKSL